MTHWLTFASTILFFVLAGCGDGTCENHGDCPSSEICVAEACVPAYGRDYRITIVDATLPETNASGDTWDFPGGLPDAYAVFADTDGSSCRTTPVDNTLSPTWDHECRPFAVNESSRYFWNIFDADDVSGDEHIAGMSEGDAVQIDLEWLRDTAFHGTAGDVRINFRIEPM